MKSLKVGLIQQRCVADVDTNRQKLAANIEDVVTRGAELVVLQELHNSLYFCQVESVNNFDLAEPIPGLASLVWFWLRPSLNVVPQVCIITLL